MTVNRKGQEKVLTMTPKETTVNGKKVYRCGFAFGAPREKVGVLGTLLTFPVIICPRLCIVVLIQNFSSYAE